MTVPVYFARLTYACIQYVRQCRLRASTGHHPTLNGYGLLPFLCLCFLALFIIVKNPISYEENPLPLRWQSHAPKLVERLCKHCQAVT